MDITKDGGVIKEVLQEGEGDCPAEGQVVELHYKGTLEDGSEFDSSYSRGTPFSFTLGDGEVIKAWEQGIGTMKKGEKAVFTCRSDYAYGEKGMEPKIPPNATLRFEVELIDFRDKEREKWELELDEKLEKAKMYKEKGNTSVKEGNYRQAKEDCYLEGLSYIEDESDDEGQEVKTLKLQLLSNLGMCELKLKEWGAAIEHCNEALQIDPNNLKVLYRRATAKLNYGLPEEALEDCQTALQVDPSSKEIKQLEVQAKKKMKAVKEQEKKRFGNMFSKISIYEEKETVLPKYEIPEEADPSNPQVYMDITIGESEPKRVVFELFANVVPKTAENFRCLCTGEKGTGASGVPLHYQNSIFHRVIKGFMMQGGDFTNHNGTGGESIYGAKFEDENFRTEHTKEGLLSMANAGPGTNGSQFFITFKETPHLNGKHVVFGRVLSGMEHVKEVENLPTDSNDKPQTEVRVVSCGQL